jgi:ATP-binding cassette, subfamily B, bacterial
LSEYLATRLRRAPDQLAQLWETVRLVWRAAPGWSLAWAIFLAVDGILPVATVYLTRPLVNGIVAAIRSRGDWRPIVVPGALMAAVLLLTELSRGATKWIRTCQAELVQDHITSLIHRKSLEADLAFYDSPDFYDHLHRARAEAGYRPIALLETLGSVAQNSITLAAMLVVVAGFGLWLAAALLLSTLPALVAVLRYAVKQYEFRMHTTPLERRSWYYDWLLTAGEAAPEMRAFALGEYFENAYRALRSRLRSERVGLARSQSRAELAAGASSLATTAAAMVWMVLRTLRGLLTLGDLALFYQAFQQGLRLARTLLENVGQLYQNSLFLGNLFEFLKLQPEVVSPAAPAVIPLELRDGIRFRNVSFRYPQTRRLALQNFDLAIPAGGITAIIGRNGAGKSTLAKLLCRFYDPQDGSITIDGVDLRRFSVEELRRRIAVLFQEPVHYNATVRENIGFGDLARSADDCAIRAAAQSAGADAFIQRLPDGYENLLGHWFEKGVELSVGEWQRLAVARVFLRRAPIIVLDEPTAAMDPWAEAEWLSRLRDLTAGRTTILITHRFTTAMLADHIHVLDDGRLLESGSHAQLLACGGRYAAWWRAQSFQ